LHGQLISSRKSEVLGTHPSPTRLSYAEDAFSEKQEATSDYI